VRCGIDLIHQDRIEDLVNRRGVEYLSKIWSTQEIADCTRTDGTLRYESLAARFAAKEAVSKAFGTGFGREGVRLEEIEIREDANGAPYVELHGSTKAFFKKRGFVQIEVSLSHDREVSIAMCVITDSNAGDSRMDH
jgi:holo-[acyl-carrier protein] synthase